MTASRALLAHLYRRAGFGASLAELDRAEQVGWDATVAHLLKGLHEVDDGPLQVQPPQFSSFSTEALPTSSALRQAEFLALQNWWIDLMASTPTPLKEKLVLLLHEQFPTAFSKVNHPSLLYRQNTIFRALGAGSFDVLTTALSKDPAMLIWLDTVTDLAAHPNENFARELLERFTMGVGHYTEEDVKQLARCFTGWGVNYQSGAFVFNTAVHDFGVKTIFGRSGAYSGEDAITLVTKRAVSTRWVTARMWSWLAYPVGPHDPVVEELAPVYGEHLHLGTLLAAILAHPSFVSVTSTTGLVKQPVEWVVGTMRALHLNTSSFAPGYVANTLTKLGQQLFNPPTVGGWGNNGFWLSTSSSLTQLNFAQTAAGLADLSAVADEPVRGRFDLLARLLGVGRWTKETTTVLHQAGYEPATLMALALVAPETMTN
ncbi:MAG TPA: DUF1800 domain-containing protein [Acidimicrobiales bacterium]|nr:DUF1800 domain-containing protein [Acidimicrobiales bacterium]